MRTVSMLLSLTLLVSAQADLVSYVRAPSPFEWTKSFESKIGNSQFVELTVVSQKWREFTWRHRAHC